jgi:acetylornithine/succinyldiaminopimelate/putrescine aminotransferase
MDKEYVEGRGCYLCDKEGRRYLDFLAQYGALPFGYNNPKIWEALRGVEERYEPSFVQPSYLVAAGQLAKRLVSIAPAGYAYATFTNSGAEAVEAAIKLCIAHTKRKCILSTVNGFHGKTLAALSATGRSKYQRDFNAPVDGYAYVPYGDLGALERALVDKRYAAFLVEPIQGEGGIIEPPPGYLSEALALCRAAGTLMVMDEIQTGLGRTGTMFASEYEGVAADVMTLAKALSGGLVPIGACLYRGNLYNEQFALKHTSTYAGNAIACRVALAALDILEENDRELIQAVSHNGARLKSALIELQSQYPDIIQEVRGRGYMLSNF